MIVKQKQQIKLNKLDRPTKHNNYTSPKFVQNSLDAYSITLRKIKQLINHL